MQEAKNCGIEIVQNPVGTAGHLKIFVFEAEKAPTVLHLLIKIHTRRTNSERKSQWHGRNRRKLKDRPRVRTTVEWYPLTKHYPCHSYVATQHQ